MKHLLLLVCTFFLVVSAKSQDNYLHQYKWKSRVLLVFAENQDDEDYKAQLEIFKAERDGFEERDLVLLSVLPYQVNHNRINKGDKKMAKSLRKKFNGTKGFSLVLIGKDGTIKLKHSHLTQVIEVYSRIDNMPMRKEEMKEQPGSN